MKSANYLLLTCMLTLGLACSKDAENHQSTKVESKSSIPPNDDPVIEKFSKYGSVTLMDQSYEGSVPSLTDHDGIYILESTEGPFAGKSVEIYNFEDEGDYAPSDCDGCDENWSEQDNGDFTFISCPDPGSDCRVAENQDGKTVLIHCTECD